MNRKRIAAAACICIALFGACSPASTTPTGASATPPPTIAAPTDTPPLTSTPAPSAEPGPTATPDPLPALQLKPGHRYFTLNGKPTFIFTRNLAGITPEDFETLVVMAHEAGNVIVRVGIDNQAMGGNHGYGYSAGGSIETRWAQRWEHFFNVAEANGIYVLPMFTGWANWNTSGFNTWSLNPFNSANGGPAASPSEFYKKDSPTQQLYLKWFGDVVARWQSHRNIAAWELVTEINLIDGIGQADGVYLARQLAQVARLNDPLHRPVTVSLADINREWPDLYRSDAVDFINYHPYPPSAKLDSYTLKHVRAYLDAYDKPVLIGESGLNAAEPNTTTGAITLAPNTRIGLQHAIWAEAVAGTMNGRAFFWEDGYGIYFPEMGMPALQSLTDLEAPAQRFLQGVDWIDFRPIPARASAGIFGAALGDQHSIIGWYRDASSEPPNWPLQPVVSGQSVTLTVPGTAAQWQVDFYDARTGTDLLASHTVAQQADQLTLALPDFTDDIAFKLVAVK